MIITSLIHRTAFALCWQILGIWENLAKFIVSNIIIFDPLFTLLSTKDQQNYLPLLSKTVISLVDDPKMALVVIRYILMLILSHVDLWIDPTYNIFL